MVAKCYDKACVRKGASRIHGNYACVEQTQNADYRLEMIMTSKLSAVVCETIPIMSSLKRVSIYIMP